jgi:hypothetical protein
MFGSHPVENLERQAVDLARELDAPIEAVEDALCIWQKRRGWLTEVETGCGGSVGRRDRRSSC